MEVKEPRLGVNIDHVATIRNARGGRHPDPLRAALLAAEAGADGITAHLREDRRHISDQDIEALKAHIGLPLNLEMAATEEMLDIALRTRPNAACIVPEKRQEVTTEGGLDVIASASSLRPYIDKLKNASIRVSLFIEADLDQIQMAKSLGADIVELHTGSYCHKEAAERHKELQRIQKAVLLCEQNGLECHAGHGLDYDTVYDIAAIPAIMELNIGHFLIGEAIYVGLKETICTMKRIIKEARESRV